MSPTAARHSSDAAIDPLWQLQVLLTQGLLFWISPLVFILVHIALIVLLTVGHPFSTTRKAQLLDWLTAARNRLYEASSGLLRFLLWNFLLGVLRSRQGAIYANAILRQQKPAYEDDKAGRYSDTAEVAARDRVIQKLSKALEWERARSMCLSVCPPPPRRVGTLLNVVKGTVARPRETERHIRPELYLPYDEDCCYTDLFGGGERGFRSTQGPRTRGSFRMSIDYPITNSVEGPQSPPDEPRPWQGQIRPPEHGVPATLT